MNKMTPAVRILLVVNVALFLLDRVIPYKLTEILGLYLPVNEKFAVWQYLTGMFMHHGVMHLIINMAGLFFFGCIVERALGSKRFVTLYFLAGIGSGLIYTLVQSYEYSAGVALVSAIEALGSSSQALSGNEIYQKTVYTLSRMYRTEVVGASGALYGVIVAIAMRYPNAKVPFKFIPFPIVAKYFVLGLISIDLVLQLSGFSPFGRFMVAHSAHLGGAFTGFLVMLYWRYRLPKHLEQS
ncbi:rhomboid family intramembrane serine protease [Leucothrix mucor]|uniref:rhomboid family intramembrane serine protease n=1 Tax=Leucothrix mucor TaxID=45248 RepID=UPI0003B5F2CE|nr:rhomboid family intramembrane serine protease [Leucothrix mucor]